MLGDGNLLHLTTIKPQFSQTSDIKNKFYRKHLFPKGVLRVIEQRLEHLFVLIFTLFLHITLLEFQTLSRRID